MTTGRAPPEAAATVGEKTRHQRFREASTVTSLEETPLTGAALGWDLRSSRFMRRRLTVPLERRAASERVHRKDIEMRALQGRTGFGCWELDVVDAIVVSFYDRRVSVNSKNRGITKE